MSRTVFEFVTSYELLSKAVTQSQTRNSAVSELEVEPCLSTEGRTEVQPSAGTYHGT